MTRPAIAIPTSFQDYLMTQERGDLPSDKNNPVKWSRSAIQDSWSRLMSELAFAITEIKIKEQRQDAVHEKLATRLTVTDQALFRLLVLNTRLWADIQRQLLAPLKGNNRLRIYRYPATARYLKTNKVQWKPMLYSGEVDQKDAGDLASIVVGDVSTPIRVTRRFVFFRPRYGMPGDASSRKCGIQSDIMERFEAACETPIPYGQAIYALRTFLQIAETYPNETGMIGPIDNLWHELILDEIGYAAFCFDEAKCPVGQIINHTPEIPGQSSDIRDKYRRTYDRLHTAYRRDGVTFPGDSVWPWIDRTVQTPIRTARPDGLQRSPSRPARPTQRSSSESTSPSPSSSPSSPSSSDTTLSDTIMMGAMMSSIASSGSDSSGYSGGDSCGYSGGDSGGYSGGGDCGGGGGDCGGGGGCSC